MIKINEQLLSPIIEEAKHSTRKRKNYNFHKELSDPLQRLLNCLEPETYCQPHRHMSPPKREVFILLIGKALVVEFDDNGQIKDSIILDIENGNYGVEIPAGCWHTIIALNEGTVVFECKDGPYIAIQDKDFAAWAPKEGSPDCLAYNIGILQSLNIN
jgi:cupin fold WbuC family metalloprotein